jgi:2-polyprenyl-3-methyl-5-hydroxy-6-metoxy-1,4-benzoquinol methylase
MTKADGGYDDGYEACPCFWGAEPGSLVKALEKIVSFDGLSVLDLGCGEGKNALYIGQSGATVVATDCSTSAIKNATSGFSHPNVTYSVGDARGLAFEEGQFDVSIAYGLLHCLQDFREVQSVISTLKAATKPGGYMVVCAFNDRDQDLSAHPGFHPFLAPHASYVELLSGWETIVCSDENLYETHPHNNVPHHHSLTRILSRKPQ